MSKPTISRTNSSSSLEQSSSEETPPKKSEDKQGPQAPSLTSRPKALTPFERVFNTNPSVQRQVFDDESSEEEQQPKEKPSTKDKEKSSVKDSDTKSQAKQGLSGNKLKVPLLKLPALPRTATLKSRPPSSPDSTTALGSHRSVSPRDGEASKSISTTNISTVDSKLGATPKLPLPTSPKESQNSNSTPPLSDRSGISTSRNEAGLPASSLTSRSKSILDHALVNGKIDPADLGYLLVDVQTEGFKKPLSSFEQGTPFLRSGLKVLDFTASNGEIYGSINLIEKFLQPLSEQVFNTEEFTNLRENLEKNYLPVASKIDIAAKGMRPKEMQLSEKLKNIMDPVIKPLTTWVCGEKAKFAESCLPSAWKSLLLSIDDAVVQWAKNCKPTNMKEVKRLRHEALVAFISTRGYMMVWGKPLQNYGLAHGISERNLTSFMNSYFAHRADKFIIDIMLSRKDLVGDVFDSTMRGYLNVLSGRKELVNAVPRENTSGRRELMKSKTLQSTKAGPASSSTTADYESTALSPRMREKLEIEKNREIKENKNINRRQKFIRDFSKEVNLATISPEFFRAFQRHVVTEMSDKAYEKFEKNPVLYCQRYLDKFYVGVLNQARQAEQQSIRKTLSRLDTKKFSDLAKAAETFASKVNDPLGIASSGLQINQPSSAAVSHGRPLIQTTTTASTTSTRSTDNAEAAATPTVFAMPPNPFLEDEQQLPPNPTTVDRSAEQSTESDEDSASEKTQES
ncbi:MAG: hypothetical protein LW714_08000 [Oxalobacteraceae bacterium]|jgi:hypothetical protein|nr:hypothetical protein [Oxalobacteraceae bacterium]